MKAELLDTMGDDLRVANAARVSFDKHHDQFENNDEGLIKFLAREGHWTPFSHVMITMRETVPIFVARQRFKHMVGFTYNEISRRYVDTPPEFFTPDVWRKAPDNRKQGSENKPALHSDELREVEDRYEDLLSRAEELYKDMVNMNVAPEQARMVLPQSMYTSYYVTGSLSAWARAYKLRSEEHSQLEIQGLARQWNDIISNIPQMKYSWAALTN